VSAGMFTTLSNLMTSKNFVTNLFKVLAMNHPFVSADGMRWAVAQAPCLKTDFQQILLMLIAMHFDKSGCVPHDIHRLG
jgi:hypothetical protein